jgi:hypothetical protein
MPENTPQKDNKQFITYGLLVLCCVLLTTIFILLYQNNQSRRYDFGRIQSDSFYIIDKKTGQVWYHYLSTNAESKGLITTVVDYGTPANPTCTISFTSATMEEQQLAELKEWVDSFNKGK